MYQQSNIDKNKKRKIIGYVQKTIKTLKRYSFGLYANELEKLSKNYSRQDGLKFPDLSECMIKAEHEIDKVNKDITVKRFLNMIMKNAFTDLTQCEKSQLSIEYKERVEKGLPPGGGDQKKINNPEGDLTIWKEILKNIKLLEANNYLFITEDKKEDNNWYERNGLNIHPILRKEVINEVGFDFLYSGVEGQNER